MADISFDDLPDAPKTENKLSFDDLPAENISPTETLKNAGSAAVSGVGDAFAGTAKEAGRTTSETYDSLKKNLSHAFSNRPRQEGEGFWAGYGRDIAALPGKIGSAAGAVGEAVALPFAPILGAAKYAVGKPMSHLLAAPHHIDPKWGPSPDQVYEDIREDVGTALNTVNPARASSPAPTGLGLPKPKAQPPWRREAGVRLSEGERTGDVAKIQDEQAALRGQLGKPAQSVAIEFKNAQEKDILKQREKILKSMSPTNDIIAETPAEAGALLSEGIERLHSSQRNIKESLYKTAELRPGEIEATVFHDLPHYIRDQLTSSNSPVVVTDKSTPIAHSLLNYIDNNISGINFRNFADPNGRINPNNIVGVSLAGVDRMRRALTTFRKAAYGGQNLEDRRATSRIIDAFDSAIDRAINGGMFSGDRHAIQAWNDARAAHSAQRDAFGRKTGDQASALMERILGRAGPDTRAAANEVANFLYGATGTTPSAVNRQMAIRVRDLFGTSSPEWAAVKQGLFSRLVDPGPEIADWGPKRINDNINKFFNRGKEVADIIFTPEEQSKIRKYAALHNKLVVPQKTANWSNNPINRILRKGVASAGALAGAGIGHVMLPGVPGIAEAAGAGAGYYLGNAFGNWRDARRIGKQMPLQGSWNRPAYLRNIAGAQTLSEPLREPFAKKAERDLTKIINPYASWTPF